MEEYKKLGLEFVAKFESKIKVGGTNIKKKNFK